MCVFFSCQDSHRLKRSSKGHPNEGKDKTFGLTLIKFQVVFARRGAPVLLNHPKITIVVLLNSQFSYTKETKQ